MPFKLITQNKISIVIKEKPTLVVASGFPWIPRILDINIQINNNKYDCCAQYVDTGHNGVKNLKP